MGVLLVGGSAGISPIEHKLLGCLLFSLAKNRLLVLEVVGNGKFLLNSASLVAINFNW